MCLQIHYLFQGAQNSAGQPPKKVLGQQDQNQVKPSRLAVFVDNEVSTSREVSLRWHLVGRLPINANKGRPEEFEILVKNITKISETAFSVGPTSYFKVSNYEYCLNN